MLKRVAICALLVTFLAGASLAQSPAVPAAPSPAQIHFEKAVTYHKAGKLDEAISEYKQVIKADPKILPAYLNMAGIYLQKQNVDAAIPLLVKAEQLDPRNAALPSQLARLYLSKNQADKATSQARLAVKLKTKDWAPYFILGNASFDKKDFSAAAGYYRKVVDLNPKDMALRGKLAYCYMQTKKYDQALKEYKKLIAANPNDLQLRRMAASAAQGANKPAEAAKQFEFIRKKDPNDTTALLALAQQAEAARDTKKTKALLQQVVKIDKKNFVALFNLGRLAFMESDYKTAKARFAEAASAKPDDVRSKLNLALAETRLGLDDDAIKHYESALKIDPKNDGALMGIAGIYENKKDYGKAIAYLKKLASLHPKEPGYLIQAAGVYAAAGRNSEAITELKDVLKKFPKNQDAVIALADTYRRDSKHEEAIKELRTIASAPQPKNSQQPSVQEMIADILIEQNRVDEAIWEYDAILKKNPKDRNALEGKARGFDRQQQWEKEIEVWNKIKVIAPKDAAPYQRIAGVKKSQNNVAGAITELEAGLKKLPDSRDLMQNLAFAYREDKQYEKAIATWRTIAKKFPEEKQPPMPSGMFFMMPPSPVDQIAGILAEQGNIKEAIAEYDPLINKDPKDVKPYKGIARIYLKEKNYAEAVAQWNKVKTLDPESDEPYLQIANIYKTQAADAKPETPAATPAEGTAANADASALTPEALAAYDKAAEEYKLLLLKDPKNRMAGQSLVGVYRQAKRYDEAIKQLQDMSAASPEDAKMTGLDSQIAAIYEEQGKTDSALEAYKKSVDEKTGPEIRLKYAALLEKVDRKADALEQYKKVIQMDPANEQAAQGVKRTDPNAATPATPESPAPSAPAQPETAPTVVPEAPK